MIKDELRPIGGFFELALLDVPPVPDSIWEVWIGRRECTLTARTARAVLAALIAAKRPRVVWMPAYLCRELASAAGKAPLRFYPLDDQLSPDTYFLRSALGAGDLIVVIDYFGWPPSKTLLELAAEQHEVIWVEDRAHCLWTQDPPWAPWVPLQPAQASGSARRRHLGRTKRCRSPKRAS